MEKLNIIKEHINLEKEITEFMLEVAINENQMYEWEDGIKNQKYDNYKDGNGELYIVMNNSNEIVGTCGIYKMQNSIAKIERLYIKRDYRKIGIASHLMNNAFEYAKKNKLKEVVLGTSNRLEKAIRLYENLGFTKYCEEDSAILYRKAI